jgi:hypothetical protein
MRRDGALELWEQRGFRDRCTRVDNPAGDHLDCSKRYQYLQFQIVWKLLTGKLRNEPEMASYARRAVASALAFIRRSLKISLKTKKNCRVFYCSK